MTRGPWYDSVPLRGHLIESIERTRVLESESDTDQVPVPRSPLFIPVYSFS